VGYHLTQRLRIETELGYVDYDRSTLTPYTADPNFPALKGAPFNRQSGADFSRVSAGVNGFYDFKPLAERYFPYLGAGVSIISAHSSAGLYVSPSGSTLRWEGGESAYGLAQVEGGVAIALTRHWSLVPAYRYIHGFSSRSEAAHIGKLGFRYTF
jgi:opacity protein-like surface antigen